MTLITFYKIESKDKSILDCYVGSTSNFPKRKKKHNLRCYDNTDRSNYQVYKFIRENNGFENFEFIILEELECETNEERYFKERELIKLHNANLNVIKNPLLTLEERKEQIKNYNKSHPEVQRLASFNYRKAHPEKIKEYKEKKKQIKINCDCGGHYLIDGKARHFKSKKHLAYLEENK
jgi:hypothetical protein